MIEYYDSFDDLTNDFFEDFKKEMGIRKFESLISKVENSSSINSLFKSSLQEGFFPNGKTLSVAILNSRYFMFSNNETLICVGLIALVNHFNYHIENNIEIDEDQFLHSAKSLIHHFKKM